MGTPDQKPRFWYSHPSDIEEVMGTIADDDVVLDIGGGLQPLARADYVADNIPYVRENVVSVKGWGPLRFSAASWFEIDLCTDPLPFADKSVDFVFCSHTISKLRDPVSLCREMIRVGKRGFVDFPSKWLECRRNVGPDNLSRHYAGYVDHRWLIETGRSHLVLTQKTALATVVSYVNSRRAGKFMHSPRIWSDAMFWEGGFTFEEKALDSAKDAIDDLKSYFESFDYSPYEKELKAVKRARNLNGDRLDRMLVHAWHHHNKGRYNLATKLLREVLRQTPDNVDAQALLGLTAACTQTGVRPPSRVLHEPELQPV